MYLIVLQQTKFPNISLCCMFNTKTDVCYCIYKSVVISLHIM